MSLEPPPPPPSRFTSCPRHPDQPVTGFCASCLRERLAGLEPASHRKPPTLPPSSSTSSSTASALKAIFRAGSSGLGDSSRGKASSSSAKCGFPELRRSKSFSGAKADRFSVNFEPQRRSCDVRVRNTLWSLFHQDDESKGAGPGGGSTICGEIEEHEEPPRKSSVNLGFDEVKEEIEEGEEAEADEEGAEGDAQAMEEGEGEIRVLEPEFRVSETLPITEIQEEEMQEEDVKTMKDHIDLDAQSKNPITDKVSAAEKRDLKEIAGSFWLAASVFSKKLQKWRGKKKRRDGDSAATTVRAEKPASFSRRFRETQSEVADYGYGRRSCDTDPRFSLDAGRMSFDDPRYSFDEPRASWDGHLIGRAAPAFPPLVRRSDNQIPVEEPMNSIEEDPMTPGGTAQTRDYYLDSSSSRRHILERTCSSRKVVAATGETDDVKSVSNSKVSPASMDYFLINKITDPKDPNSNSNSLRDDCSESFESAYRDAAAIAGGGSRKGSKKSRRWSKAWNIWGLIHWRGSNKEDDDDDDRYSRANVVERSFSESWPELRREMNGYNGDTRGAYNRKVFRSNSSISSRNSFSNGNFGGVKSYREVNGHSKKRREEFVLERNRSARFSPSHFDNGLLRFYLTPLTSSRRSSGSGKSRSRSSHSFARSMLRLY